MNSTTQPLVQSVAWECPSNIALIKYWGKQGDQLPMNASLSLTLNQAMTRTILSWQKRQNESQRWLSVETGSATDNAGFEKKILKYLEKLSATEMPFLKEFTFSLQTRNTFPHSTGIASSASGFGALGLCLCSFERVLRGKKPFVEASSTDAKDFFIRASHLARLGSGSASRSLYGPLVMWGETQIEDKKLGNQQYATAIETSTTHWAQQVRDAILVVDSSPKSVSSTVGHSLMNDHPYADLRFLQARKNMAKILQAVDENDWSKAGQVTEDEALSLHALMMTSRESFVLLKPNTLSLIEKIRRFRLESGTQVYFTLDAGPNIHLLYLEKDAQQVKRFIQEDLVGLCEKGFWIDDKVGNGPVPFYDYREGQT